MTSVSIPALPMVWAHIAAFAAALSLSAAVPGSMTGLLPPLGEGWDGGLLPSQAPTLPSPNGGGKKAAGPSVAASGDTFGLLPMTDPCLLPAGPNDPEEEADQRLQPALPSRRGATSQGASVEMISTKAPDHNKAATASTATADSPAKGAATRTSAPASTSR
jgi:hypothetical protein